MLYMFVCTLKSFMQIVYFEWKSNNHFKIYYLNFVQEPLFTGFHIKTHIEIHSYLSLVFIMMKKVRSDLSFSLDFLRNFE